MKALEMMAILVITVIGMSTLTRGYPRLTLPKDYRTFIVSVEPAKRTVTIFRHRDDSEQVFTLLPDSSITVNGRKASLDEVKVGMLVVYVIGGKDPDALIALNAKSADLSRN